MSKKSTKKITQFGQVEQWEEKAGRFHVKITNGFSCNAMNTFKCMKMVISETKNKFPIIHKMESDENLFHLILKP